MNIDVNELFQRYEKSGRKNRTIKEAIFFASQGLVYYILQHNGHLNEDTIQEAYSLLWEAIDKYNANKASWSTFAIMYVVNGLKKYYRNTSWTVHVPTSVSDQLVRPVVKENLDASPKQLAQEANIDIKKAERILQAARKNTIQPLDEELTFSDDDTTMLLSLALDKLSTEQYVVLELWVDGYNKKEISRQLGMGYAKIQKILDSAIETLRKELSG